MMTHILCVLLIVISSSVLLVENRSYNTGLIFYDLPTKQIFLPPTVSVSRGRSLADFKFSSKGSIWSTFGKPCDCSGPLCGCCVGIKVKQYNFDQKMCANVSYVQPKDEVNLQVFLNETQSGRYGISARNPSPLCIPIMMPIPMSMCVQMTNVGLQGDNLNMCMDFLVRLASAQLFEMHFQCMKMGAQGVQWVGADGQPVIPPSESKLKQGSKERDSQEYYDEGETEALEEEEEGEGEGETDDDKDLEEEQEVEENLDDVQHIENEENNEIDFEDEEKQEENDLASVPADGLNAEDANVQEEDNEVTANLEKGVQSVEEYENTAQEIMDDNEKDLKNKDQIVNTESATELQASEGEEIKDIEADTATELQASEEEQLKDNEVILIDEKIKDKEILKIPLPSNGILQIPTEMPEVMDNLSLANENEMSIINATNESLLSEILSPSLPEMLALQQLQTNPIINNLNPTLATTEMALENFNEINNIDNAATIATITSSTVAIVTSTIPTTLEPQDNPATIATPVATSTVAAFNATTDMDTHNNNSSDNSQDNDSDYENEESDENEKDEENEEEVEAQLLESKNENKNEMTTFENESPKEQLESVSNINVTIKDFNLSHDIGDKDNNNDIKSKEESQENSIETEDNTSEDEDNEEADGDENETEEDSDESLENSTQQNIELTTLVAPTVTAALLDGNNLATLTEISSKLQEMSKNTTSSNNSNYEQLSLENTTLSNLDQTGNLNFNISAVSNMKDSNNHITNNFSTNINQMSSNALADVDIKTVAADDSNITTKEHVQLSQITAGVDTVTPLTSARKLFALSRPSHLHQQQQQLQQKHQQRHHKQIQRQRLQKQQQHHQQQQLHFNKWQYPLHQQQVQHHQHPNNLLRHSPIYTTSQQRRHQKTSLHYAL